MGSFPDCQQDLFEPPSKVEALPTGVRTRLRPLLLALLTEAVSMGAAIEAAGEEIGDDQDHV